MIYSASTPQQFFGTQPEKTEILIIGGGIIGVCAAYYLAKAGRKVTLCEKGRISGEQSSRNWGWIRAQGRDEEELPLAIRARKLWRDLAQECADDLTYQTTGVYYLAEKPTDLENFEKFAKLAKSYDLDTRMISQDEVHSAIQGKPGRWIGGMHTPADGRVEPGMATCAIARAAERHGTILCENTSVRTLVKTAGEVTGVVTEHGEIAAEQIILAGGAWSSLFLANAGIKLPQLGVELTVAATQAVPDVFSGNASDNTFALRRRQDGGYTVALKNNQTHHLGWDSLRFFKNWLPNMAENLKGTSLRPAAPRHYPNTWTGQRRWTGEDSSPFERMRILNSKPDPKELKALEAAFVDRFPQLEGTQLQSSWGGMIDAMPDFLPVIDRPKNARNLHITTGFSGHGFGIGPSVGEALAQSVQGQQPSMDLSPFALARF